MIFYFIKIYIHIKYIYLKLDKRYSGFFSSLHELSLLNLGKAFMPIPIRDKNISLKFYRIIFSVFILFIISVIGIFVSIILSK